MTKPDTQKLIVNLSASQTRRRLKGHGFGVRRVEAADRNQAVVTHTATGQHLRELELLFADVLPRASGTSEQDGDVRITDGQTRPSYPDRDESS